MNTRAIPYAMVWVVIALMGLSLTGGFYAAFAQNGYWTDKYQGAGATPCCGARDCFKVHARLLGQTPTVVTLEVNGVVLTIPSLSFHTSEDSADYWCALHSDEPISSENTRCAFLAVGS